MENFLNEDETRIVWFLLGKNTCELKTKNNTKSIPIECNIGSPQGDGTSGDFFTVYFENSSKTINDE